MKVVILVGGMGTRLQPLTLSMPKPMMPIANIPLLEHTIAHLKRFGLDDIILSTCYLPHVFEDYFGDGKDFGVKLTYVEEKEPLGTCGAVKNVEKLLDGTFMVMNGDVITGVDIKRMIEYHVRKKAVGTIYLTPVSDPTSYGLVILREDGVVEDFLEKPSWDQVTTNLINAGIYILEPDVLELVPKGQNYSFERGLFPSLLKQEKPLYGFPSTAYWIDIGTPEKYLQVNGDVLEGRYKGAFRGSFDNCNYIVGEGTEIDPTATIFGNVVLGKNCKVGKNVTISFPTVIGDGCVLEENVILESSVVMSGSKIGPNSVVRGSIIGPRVTIGESVLVSDLAVVGEGCVVKRGNQLKNGIKLYPGSVIEQNTIKF